MERTPSESARANSARERESDRLYNGALDDEGEPETDPRMTNEALELAMTWRQSSA